MNPGSRETPLIAPVVQPAPEVGLEDALADVSQRLEWLAAPEQKARLMNFAGDLCVEADQQGRALLYYDSSIDLYVAAGRFASAAAICNKLIGLNPDIVRARCTLAWLAIARGLDDQARRLVEEYGEAALRLERPMVAQQQLRAMAEETDSDDVLEAISEALLKLGDAASADRVFGSTAPPATRSPKHYPSPLDRQKAIVARVTRAWCG
jgi:tetratricopeptide (TPR) repeat protein